MTDDLTTEPLDPEGYDTLRAMLRDVSVPSQPREQALRAALDEFDIRLRPSTTTAVPRPARRWTTRWAVGLLGAGAAALIAVVSFQALNQRSGDEVAFSAQDTTGAATKQPAAVNTELANTELDTTGLAAPETAMSVSVAAADAASQASSVAMIPAPAYAPPSPAAEAEPSTRSATAGGAAAPDGAPLNSLDELRSWVAARHEQATPSSTGGTTTTVPTTTPEQCPLAGSATLLGTVVYRQMPALVTEAADGSIDVLRIDGCLIIAHLVAAPR